MFNQLIQINGADVCISAGRGAVNVLQAAVSCCLTHPFFHDLRFSRIPGILLTTCVHNIPPSHYSLCKPKLFEHACFCQHTFKPIQCSHVTRRWSEWFCCFPAKKACQHVLLLLRFRGGGLRGDVILHVPKKLKCLPANIT